jgi:very-short-patch-repair endonuclease
VNILAVSYKKLWVRLAEHELSTADLRKQAKIAPNTMDFNKPPVIS